LQRDVPDGIWVMHHLCPNRKRFGPILGLRQAAPREGPLGRWRSPAWLRRGFPAQTSAGLRPRPPKRITGARWALRAAREGRDESKRALRGRQSPANRLLRCCASLSREQPSFQSPRRMARETPGEVGSAWLGAWRLASTRTPQPGCRAVRRPPPVEQLHDERRRGRRARGGRRCGWWGRARARAAAG